MPEISLGDVAFSSLAGSDLRKQFVPVVLAKDAAATQDKDDILGVLTG